MFESRSPARARVVAILLSCAAATVSLVLAAPAEANPDSRFRSEAELSERVASIQLAIEQMHGKLAAGADVHAERAALDEAQDALLDIDERMRAAFAERERRLLDAGLAPAILQRHQRTVEQYEVRFDELLERLDAIDGASGRRAASDLNEAVRLARRYLRRHKSRDPERFLSQSGLPLSSMHREAPVRDIAEKDAALAQRSAVAAPAAPRGIPTPADLAATIDVQLDDAAAALATQLGNDPLAMFRHVRDNFRFEPYVGSRKGSREALLVQGGNAHDQASALIALLRSAGIPARYASGTVLMPAEQVKSWLGVTDGGTAAAILATGGLDPVAYTQSGQVVEIQFEHVWVLAYIPFGNYRGVLNDDTGGTWVALDPSFKRQTFASTVDIPEAMGFDAEDFLDEYITTLREQSPVELFTEQIEDYVQSEHPELSYPQDVFRNGQIDLYALGILPGSLPFTQLEAATEFAEIPAQDRHRIRFHIHLNAATYLDHTLDLPSIASRRTTISYDPATPDDLAVVESYGDLYSTPPDLIEVKPVLRIEGAAVATGSAVGAGILHQSDMHFLTPAQESNVVPSVFNTITAGTYQGIGIDTWTVAPEALINGPDEALPDTDGLTGEKLYRTAMTYLDRVDRSGRTVAGFHHMVVTTAVSEAIVENVIRVLYSFGTPVAWEWKGLIVDADRKIIGPFAIDGDDSKSKPFFVLAGADGSVLENRVFEDMYGEEAVSTIKILALASDKDIAVCRIITSIAADCPTLSQPAAVVNAVNAALAQGHVVTIPRTALTHFNWSGTGYIDMDPDTGAAGYIISGGQSGGATVDVWTSPWGLIMAVIGQDVCNITANIVSPAANSNFPYPGPFSGVGGTQPAQFVVQYTVYYCEDDPRDVTEIYQPHFQYPPGNFVFHAGWGTGATLPFTVFEVLIEPGSYMGKGYTGTFAGIPEPGKIRYLILPPSFVPAKVELTLSGGASRMLTLPNTAGLQTAEFDGKNDGGTFLDTGSYTVKIRVESSDGKVDTTKNATLDVVEVISVELVNDLGNALDDNDHPTAPGGKRQFVGRSSPEAGSINDEVTVRATLSASVPAGKLTVQFRSFDVDDPTGLIDANHGGFLVFGTPAEGSLDDTDPSTDGDDTVETKLTVTRQPGDNFKVFASTNKGLIDGLTDAVVESNTDSAGDTMDATLMPLSSDRLTVWRRVHVERDSMGAVSGNVISGDLTKVQVFGLVSIVTTDQLLVDHGDVSPGRFSNGTLRNDGNVFRVQSAGVGADFTVTVENFAGPSGTVTPVEGSFTLVDDDDYNADDGGLKDGDEGEDVRNALLTRFSNADDEASNAYAPAYIRPIFDVGDNNSNVDFLANTPDGPDEEALLLATYDFDQIATEADADYWTVYLLGAYQMQTEEDGDPDGGGTLGQVDDIQGVGGSIFLEMAREAIPSGGACLEELVVAHEMGHLFSLVHTDLGMMEEFCNNGTSSFSNDSLRRMRDLDHP